MKSFSRIAGKKYEPQGLEKAEGFQFERRPGGWVMATRVRSDGSIERVRFFHSKARKNFFTKLACVPPVEYFGEKVQVSRGTAAGSGGSDYTAQFPGKVRKIQVTEGDAVKAGTPLVMVEAMKMEFAIKASADGVVIKVLVVEGAQLVPGQLLLEFEEKKS